MSPPCRLKSLITLRSALMLHHFNRTMRAHLFTLTATATTCLVQQYLAMKRYKGIAYAHALSAPLAPVSIQAGDPNRFFFHATSSLSSASAKPSASVNATSQSSIALSTLPKVALCAAFCASQTACHKISRLAGMALLSLCSAGTLSLFVSVSQSSTCAKSSSSAPLFPLACHASRPPDKIQSIARSINAATVVLWSWAYCLNATYFLASILAPIPNFPIGSTLVITSVSSITPPLSLLLHYWGKCLCTYRNPCTAPL